MTARSLTAFFALAAVSHAAPVKSGHASAEWISGPAPIEGGKPVQTGIRLVIDPGWHSYWLNPGDSGMKLKVVWNLPEGWVAGDLEHPVPMKFQTGDLAGYGYGGTVVFPVTLTPPPGAAGSAGFSATVSWLTCNDASCVPGKVELKWTPSAGTAANAEAIGNARARVPRPLEGLKLEVSDARGELALALQVPGDASFDPSAWEVFPATEQAVDHREPIRFRKDGGKWTARAPLNPYAPETLKELRLVFGKDGETPVEASWKAD